MKASQSFEKKTKNSFAEVREDMDNFKRSMNEWVVHLDNELIEAKERIIRLESQLQELESRRHLGL